MPVEQPGQAFASGAELGSRYRLERRVGAGGMASVWLATDAELDRPVAVKVLSDVFADDEAYVARFRRESRVAAGFSHPSLIRVFDFSGEGERPYMVMEYVPGGTLAERIDADEVGQDVEGLASELLGALEHIHEAGVVHRDIKPANVLFDDAGRARLTDFGIAQPEDATRLTRTGNVVGTLRYMAPEVLEGQPADARSDLYSLGVLLGECAGERPAPGLAGLIERLTARNPSERPLTASAALALLADGTGGAEPTAPTRVIAPAPEPISPPPSAAAAPAGRRELHLDGGHLLMGLAAFALLIAVALLLLTGGDGGGGSARDAATSGPGSEEAAQGDATSQPAGEKTTDATAREEPAEEVPAAEEPPAEEPPVDKPAEAAPADQPPADESLLPPGQVGKPEKEPKGKANGQD